MSDRSEYVSELVPYVPATLFSRLPPKRPDRRGVWLRSLRRDSVILNITAMRYGTILVDLPIVQRIVQCYPSIYEPHR